MTSAGPWMAWPTPCSRAPLAHHGSVVLEHPEDDPLPERIGRLVEESEQRGPEPGEAILQEDDRQAAQVVPLAEGSREVGALVGAESLG